jgi:hypothetical protein
MPSAGHCRHCYGNCSGNCLLPGGGGLCIHRPALRLTVRQRLALVRTRGFWRRVFWGSR